METYSRTTVITRYETKRAMPRVIDGSTVKYRKTGALHTITKEMIV